MFPSVALVEFVQFFVACHGVELDVEVKFSQANGAQVLRLDVGFVEIIGTIHQTIEIDAVIEAEHVAGFVGQDLTAALENDLAVVVVSFSAEKRGIVTNETIDADSLAERSLAKNIIPFWVWIKVFHGDAEETVGIRRQQRLQVVQDRERVQLTFVGVFVGSGSEEFFVESGGRQDFDGELEECFGVGAKFFERRAGLGGKFAKRKKIDRVSRGVGPIEAGGGVGFESLARLLMHREPVAKLWRAQGGEIGVSSQESLKQGRFLVDGTESFRTVEGTGRLESKADGETDAQVYAEESCGVFHCHVACREYWRRQEAKALQS